MMKKLGYFLIALGGIGLVFFIGMEVFDAEQSYFAGWLPSFAIMSLGFSFVAFSLTIVRRKKIARTALWTSLIMLVLFFIFKHYSFRGASFFPVLFFDFFVLLFLPQHTKIRIDKWKQYTRKNWHAVVLSLADQVSLGLVFGGLLFRVFHWPLANVFLIIGLVFLIVTFIGWNQLFSREIILRKQAEEKVKESFTELKEQHHIIEEKNLEILASITYAKRLQDAILPSQKIWRKHLPESFVLYLPKDIVAGDFYWMEQVGDYVLFAAADCTGHGVPGAIVSVVCSNALNRAVKEFGIIDPGKILDKVRELVKETFAREEVFDGKSENEVKDGMDISLCSLNKISNELYWAGANNPLWIVNPPVNYEEQVQEIKADKQPIGKYLDESNFITHLVKAQKGSMIYLFTDGFADQFGGPLGKKYKYKQLKILFSEICERSLNEQQQKLEQVFFEWKKGLEQVDDICIVGVRI